MKGIRNIELDANKIAFLLDAISLFDDDDGDYEGGNNGEYTLSDDEIDKFVMSLKDLLEDIKSGDSQPQQNNSRGRESSYWNNIRPDYL